MGATNVTVRVGFVGCGFIAQYHSRGVRALVDAGLVDAEVVATLDVDDARAESFARAHGAAVAKDLAELVAGVDAVWISTPTSSHRAILEAAVGAGCAVFCEKPLALTTADATAMLDAAETAGVGHQVGLVLRTAPVFLALAEVLESGRLGRPMAAVFRDDQFLPNQGHYASTWRSDVGQAGGGTLIEHSIHDLDLLRWFLGEAVEVAARTACFAGHEGIEDVAVATITFESGATATLASIWHQVLTRPSTRRLEVFCERGLAWLDDDHLGPLHVETSDEIEHIERPAPTWVADLPIADERWRRAAGIYAVANRAFLDDVAAGRRPRPGLDIAVAAHRLADAAYASAAAGGATLPVALLDL